MWVVAPNGLLYSTQMRIDFRVYQPDLYSNSRSIETSLSSHDALCSRPTGFAQFYAKDASVTFAPTAHPSNYITVISLAAATPEAGFALLDMAKVVKAFDDGLAMLPASAIDYVAAGPGDSIWTTIERGSDYAAIPIWRAEINACVSTMRDFFLVLCPSVFEIASSTNTALALACVMVASHSTDIEF
jgi:hypothetical protein